MFSASSINTLADMAIPANAWTKFNQLNVNPPITHDFIPIIDPVPSPFINFPFPGGSPDLSNAAGYMAWCFGHILVNNASGSTASIFVTFDQGGFGDMVCDAVPTGVTQSVRVLLLPSITPTGGQPSLWIRSTQAVTIKAAAPITDHSGNTPSGTRICLVVYPVPH